MISEAKRSERPRRRGLASEGPGIERIGEGARFRGLSFSGQFLVLSLGILIVGMTTIGLWIQSEVKNAVIARTAGVTALYIDSFVSPLLEGLAQERQISAEVRGELDALLTDTALGREIVSFKIWLSDGTVAFSAASEMIGMQFDVDADLRRALDGEVVSAVSDLSEDENAFERERWDSLIETYAPVRASGSGRVIAVLEFYQLPDDLVAEIRGAQVRTWLVVGVATLTMYALLVGIVRRASSTIRRQRSDLEGSVTRLETTLDENRRLHKRTRQAAAKTTALNERYLHRISADIHDGPAQDIALALLRMEGVAAAVPPAADDLSPNAELGLVHSILSSALDDLRGIVRGLRIPDIGGLTPAEVAQRAADDVARLTGVESSVEHEGLPDRVPEYVKIATYRVVHEGLVNTHRHAGGTPGRVSLRGVDGSILIEVHDDGPGFDISAAESPASLGLAGLRERVEMLGGTFEVVSEPGAGTTLRALVPSVDAGDIDV